MIPIKVTLFRDVAATKRFCSRGEDRAQCQMQQGKVGIYEEVRLKWMENC